MPLHWTVSHPQRLVIAVAKGEVQAQEVETYLEDIFAKGGGPYRKLFDVSQAEGGFDDSVLKGFAEWVRRHASGGPIGPIAIVALSDESFRQAGVFAAAATVDRPIKIFRQQHEARRWLNAFAEEEQRLDEKRDAIRSKRT
jgi:hypothetical protein